MVRLAMVGALLMLLLAIAQDSTYRTIVTTVNDEAKESWAVETCRHKIQGVKMEFCAMYLKPYVVLLSHMDKMMQKCCDELQNLNVDCKCQAIQDVVEELNRQPLHQEERQAINSRVQELVEQCGIPRQCQIRQD